MEFEDLHREHVPAVWRYVRSRVPSDEDAEDVTSEVFLKAVRSWGHYDAEQGSVGAWLVGVARHAVADWWRQHRREQPGGPEHPGGADGGRESTWGADWDDPETSMLRQERDDELRRRLGMLTVRERDAVAMRFGAELSSAEIGEVLGVSPTAARMLVYRAVRKLRAVMQDD